jgi:hypothetical protein
VKLTLELPGAVRVTETSDYKGNPLTVLLIGDTEILYAEGHQPGDLPADAWEDVFRARLARILAGLLLDGGIDSEIWHRDSPTGRGTWGRDSSAYEVHLTQRGQEG